MNKRLKFGFTLIEVLATIVIIASMASMALVSYSTYLTRVRSQEGTQILIAVWGAQREYFRSHNAFFVGDINQISNATDFNVSITSPKNFTDLQAQDPAAGPQVCAQPVVARITEASNKYRIGITSNGSIVCGSSAGACPHALCSKIGF